MAEWIAQESTAEEAQSEHSVGETIGNAIAFSCCCLTPILFVASLVMTLRKRTAGWKFVTILSGLLTLPMVVFVVLAFFQGIRESVLDQVDEMPTTITSSDGMLRLTIPPSWVEIADLHEDASIKVGNGLRDEYLVVLTDLKEDFVGDLDDHVDTTVGQMLETNEDAKVTRREPTQVAGYDARKVELRGTVDRARIVYLQITIEAEDAFHQVLAWTLSSKREDAFGVFKKTLSTLEVVEE